MTKIKAIWDNWNREHIRKHGVSVEEVESLINSDFFTSSGHSGRRLLTARVGDRILTVVAGFEGDGVYIVTARDASKEERQNYYDYEEKKNH